MQPSGKTLQWRRASSSDEVLKKLRIFANDGLSPQPVDGETYYFTPIEALPWPADSDPEYWMHDVQRFYIDHYKVSLADDNDILFASTSAFGEVVIVPFRFLPCDVNL